MEKRLTMILAALFLWLGTALAQTAVIGMETQEVTVKGRSVRVVLLPVMTDLDEVMVVAYGTTTKSAFTGSAAVVKSDDIAKISSSNALSALTGKVSGVQINSASGAPGEESFNIRIRGISSISAESTPLIVVDGIPYDGELNNINQNDIASMTVLKDAASASLYGARGANGVVIITTKSAEQGRTSITVDAKWGANTRGVEFYNTVESPAAYYETYYNALKNYSMLQGNDASAAHNWAVNNMFSGAYNLGYNVYTVPQGQSLIGTDGKLNPNATLGRVVNGYMLYPDSWRDAVYQTGLRQEYNVTATGSNANGSFYGSAGYLKNEGIAVGSDYSRFTGRLKADYQLKPWLKVGANFNYAHYTSNYLADDGGSTVGNVFVVKNIAPIYPFYIRDAQGNILQDPKTGLRMYDFGDGSVTGVTRPTLTNSNPIFANYFDENQREGNSLDANGFFEIRFLKDFKFTSNNSVLLDETRFTSTQNPFYGQFASSNGAVDKQHVRTWSYNYQQLLNWHHLYGKHDVEVMLGHEYYRTRNYTLYASKSNIFSVTNSELAGAVTSGSATSYTGDYNVEGWFGRAQYNYDQKYFGSFSYRRDASSRFHPDHRWGNFWSVGGAWIISKESWFNAPWIDELKFKASYGEQGNDNIGSYRYTDVYTIAPAGDGVGLVPSTVKGNPEITWEKGGNFNTGFEFSLFRGRLSGSIEYFYRKTTDMLDYFALPASSGYGGYYDNIGDMRNQGVEVELFGTPIRTKDFEWGINLNFTAYDNKILTIADDNKTTVVEGVPGYQSGQFYYGEGESLYTFYMPKYAGVDEEGRALFYRDVYENKVDANGQPVVDANGDPVREYKGREVTTDPSSATNYLCGTALPWAYGGFGTTLSYKGFDLSIDFSYQIGGQIYDSDYAGMMSMSSTARGGAIHADLLDAWSPENTGSNIPRLVIDDVNATTTSDRFLTDASYLSLQNLNFGYTFPAKWTTKLGVNKLRLYLTATNLWLWSKRQGLDPRQSISGSASTAYYSAMRTISGGISITF